MRFVVDTNILFTYFWKETATKKLLLSPKLDLYAPEYALEEIRDHKQEIIAKTSISEKTFDKLLLDLAVAVIFMPVESYKKQLSQAINISPDPNDADFFALSLVLELPLWTNDAKLKKQEKILVLSTMDLIEKHGKDLL